MNYNWRAAVLWSICYCFFLGTEAHASTSGHVTDSIPEIERRIYNGYRIHLTEIKVQQKKNNQIKIKYTAINTGREPVSLGNSVSTPESLIIHFDGSLAKQGLSAHADQIRQQLAQSSLRLEPGFIRRDLSLSFSTKGTTKSGKQDMVIKGNPQKSVPVSKQDISETELEEKEKEVKRQAKEKTQSESAPLTPEMDINACSDLSIQSVKVKNKSKKHITLEITLINQGVGPARIYRDENRKQPQVAIRGNFSSTENLSRGDIVIGGDYVETKNDNPHGWLKPNETYTTSVKFDMRKKSKFTPYIILELDAYNGLAECDETNNLGVVKVE